MQEWIWLLAPAERTALGAVRTLPGLQAAETPEYIYLRGRATHHPELQSLPARHRFLADEKGLLFPVQGLTPVGKLPALDWQDLPAFLPVEPPVAAMPGQLPAPVQPVLVATDQVQPGFGWLTELVHWKAWAETAPAVRLHRLRFAVSASHQVLVTGQPLPAVPGREYWLQEGILVPAGYEFAAAILPGIIMAELNPDGALLLLFEADASWQGIPLNAFVPATRSAVRLTEPVNGSK